MEQWGLMAGSDKNIINSVAPVVVSASRATDIPAFYAEWFFCAYCYANASREIVMRNAERHSPDSETLIG